MPKFGLGGAHLKANRKWFQKVFVLQKNNQVLRVIMACCFVGAFLSLSQKLCRFSSFMRTLCVLEHQQQVYCNAGEILPCLKKNTLKIGPSSQKLSPYRVTGPVLELVQQLNKTFRILRCLF